MWKEPTSLLSYPRILEVKAFGRCNSSGSIVSSRYLKALRVGLIVSNDLSRQISETWWPTSTDKHRSYWNLAIKLNQPIVFPQNSDITMCARHNNVCKGLPSSGPEFLLLSYLVLIAACMYHTHP